MTSPDNWSSGRPDPGWGDMRGMADEFLEEFLNHWLTRNFTGTDTFEDYQHTLNERFELLEKVSGYCNLAMKNTWAMTGGQAVPIPFDDQLGPNKRAQPYKGIFTSSNKQRCGILLEDAGTWDARARVTIGDGTVIGNNGAQLYLSLWNKDTRELLSEASFNTFIGGGRRTVTIIETFVVPPELAGKAVVCCTFAHPGQLWSIVGGDRPSRLSVNRWDIETEGGRIPGTGGDAPSGGTYD